MKRNQIDDRCDDHGDIIKQATQCKKMKMTSNEYKTFSDLPQDELSVVLQYLPIGSLLMFSLVSKANYDFVRDQVKNNICKYVVYENNSWSLVDALRLVMKKS